MVTSSFLDVCRFTPTLGGTTDWTYSAAVVGYESPTAAGAVNGAIYRYRAESSDLSQWEVGYGAYNSSTGVLARTTVLRNSSGTGTGAGQSGAGSKISFSTVPQVAVVMLAQDLPAQTTLRQVATGCKVPDISQTTNKQMMSRSRHIARDNIKSVQVAFPTWCVASTSGSPESNVGGTVTLQASIEFPVGTVTMLLFSGNTAASGVAAGGNILSDALQIDIPDGSVFFVRTFYAGTAGVVFKDWSSGPPGPDLASGEACAISTTTVPNVVASPNGTITDSGFGLIYSPVAIIAQSSRPAVLVIGDSRAAGHGDSIFDTSSGVGSIGRSLAQRIGYINAGIDSDTSAAFLASHTNRVALAAYCTNVVCEYGINDIVVNSSSAATVIANIQSIRALFPTLPFYQTTFEPETTSTDGWGTLVNQTVSATNSVRISANTSIRAGISGVTGFFDIASALESSLNSGKWQVTTFAFTTDGVHSDAGACLVAAWSQVVNVGVFV